MKLGLEELARRYDLLAERYDAAGVEDPQVLWRHTSTNLVLTALEAEPDDVALDLGCGTGNVAVTLAPHVREVVGVDCSEGMLARARSRPCPRGRLRLRQGDLRAPPAVPELNLITANWCLQHLDPSELSALWRWAHRVLPPGGILSVAGPFWTVPPEQVEGVESWVDPQTAHWHGAVPMMEELERVGFQVLLRPLHPVVSALTAARP